MINLIYNTGIALQIFYIFLNDITLNIHIIFKEFITDENLLKYCQNIQTYTTVFYIANHFLGKIECIKLSIQ